MSISVAQLESYIQAGLNVLITGEPGTGKTAMLKEAVDRLGLTMKYYSASTMDPFADLLGIPVPNTEAKSVEYYRPRDVDNADVIFLDELSRASLPTLNALLELVQTKSINGEPLPKLKCVIAAMNPADANQGTDTIPAALADRFDVYLEAKVAADYTYLKRKYGASYARAGVKIFDDYQRSYNAALRSNKNKLGYLSPRRLDKLMEIYKVFPKAETVRAVLPADVVVSAPSVAAALKLGLNPEPAQAPTPAPKAKPAVQDGAMIGGRALAQRQLTLSPSAMRSSANNLSFVTAYRWARSKDKVLAEQLRDKLAIALSYQVGPDTIVKKWGEAVKDFNVTQRSNMMRGWTTSKIRTMNNSNIWN